MTAAAPEGDASPATLLTRAAATAPLAAAVGAATVATTAAATAATAAALGAELLGVETRDAPVAESEAEADTQKGGKAKE